MPHFDWNSNKNHSLKTERGISFEDIVITIDENGILEDYPHPNQKKYPNQRILVVVVNDYACLVPYVENDDAIFLKTIIPSRQATKNYISNN